MEILCTTQNDTLENHCLLAREKQRHQKSTLLAWSSHKTNKINTIDLETQQSYVNFDGVQLSDTSNVLKSIKLDMN